VIGIFCELSQVHLCKPLGFPELLDDMVSVQAMICCNRNPAPWDETMMEHLQQLLLKQPVFVMAIFRPWIGEHDDELRDSLLIEVLPHELPGISLEYGNVVHTPFFHFLAELSSTAAQYLRAYEVAFQVLQGVLHKEVAVSRSDFHDEGV